MFIVRHGETTLNVHKAFQGHADSPLTENGHLQARANGRQLKALHPEMQWRIISSDLPRAMQTASIISEVLGCSIARTDNNLREVYFGFWDGMADEDIIEKYPELWAQRQERKWTFNGYDGESYQQAHARALNWIGQHDAPNTLIVTHRSFGKILRGAYAGLTPDEIMATDFLHTEIYRMQEGLVHEIS